MDMDEIIDRGREMIGCFRFCFCNNREGRMSAAMRAAVIDGHDPSLCHFELRIVGDVCFPRLCQSLCLNQGSTVTFMWHAESSQAADLLQFSLLHRQASTHVMILALPEASLHYLGMKLFRSVLKYSVVQFSVCVL